MRSIPLTSLRLHVLQPWRRYSRYRLVVNYKARRPHRPRGYLILVKKNDQAIVLIQIKILIGVNGLKTFFLRPNAAGYKVIAFTGLHLFGHLPQDIGADNPYIIAALSKQIRQFEHLPGPLVQGEAPAVLA